MLAFTYYAHREKLRLVGKEDALEEMNRTAIRLARVVAQEGAALVAGMCATPTSTWTASRVRADGACHVRRAVGWAVDEGVDFIVAETIGYVSEALLALDAIKESGLPAVVNLAIFRDPHTRTG